jgi:hypothetical protein
MTTPERLVEGFQLPDKGRLHPTARLRFDFQLQREGDGYLLRGTLVDFGRQELLGSEHSFDDTLVPRAPAPISDTLETFFIEAPTVSECIDGVCRRVTRGRICSRDSELVTTVPASLRDSLHARWLAD